MYYVNVFNTIDSDKRARTHDKPRTRARVFCAHAARRTMQNDRYGRRFLIFKAVIT